MTRTKRRQPKVVATVQHRKPDDQGRLVAHNGYVVHRTAEHIAIMPGEYAAYARKVVEGVVAGPPVKFRTFDSGWEAERYARYAASHPPKDKVGR